MRQVFPGQKKNEKIILFVRKHWLVFLGKIFILFVMLLIPVVLLFILHRFIPQLFMGTMVNIWVILGASYLLLLGVIFLISFIDYYFDIVILTNERLVDITQKNLFNRSIDELDLFHIEDVRSKVKGLIKTFFNYGDAEIQTAGAARNFIFQNIPDPRGFTRTVTKVCDDLFDKNDRRDTIRKHEGLHNRKNPDHKRNAFENEEKSDFQKSIEKNTKDIESKTENIESFDKINPPEHSPKENENENADEKSSNSNPKIKGDLEEGKTIDFSKLENDDK